MMKTKIGVISDLHLFNKTVNIENAIVKANEKGGETTLFKGAVKL